MPSPPSLSIEWEFSSVGLKYLDTVLIKHARGGVLTMLELFDALTLSQPLFGANVFKTAIDLLAPSAVRVAVVLLWLNVNRLPQENLNLWPKLSGEGSLYQRRGKPSTEP